MKKTLIVLFLLLSLALSACGGSDPAETAQDYVGREVSELVEVIGEADEVVYQSSCATDNAEDGFWEYETFTVITLKTEDGETIQRVDLK